MDALALDRIDRGMLFAAVGPHGRLFVSMIFGAIVAEHGLHVHLERDGRDFVLIMIETTGDVVVAEHRLPVAWDSIDEDVRFGVLHLYVDGLLSGHRRWLRRMGLPRATSSAPAND